MGAVEGGFFLFIFIFVFVFVFFAFVGKNVDVLIRVDSCTVTRPSNRSLSGGLELKLVPGNERSRFNCICPTHSLTHRKSLESVSFLLYISCTNPPPSRHRYTNYPPLTRNEKYLVRLRHKHNGLGVYLRLIRLFVCDSCCFRGCLFGMQIPTCTYIQ